MCFSDSGESVWDIAKRYSTEPSAIEEQNPAAEQGRRRALIIPIKN
ncbi:MAG: LysM peptidoglycan-binding domain-containing protein [Ruminococcus sp.]|nr:LysM peptidoglycan-binding domain-containing protein [Ruminococcus sp.]